MPSLPTGHSAELSLQAETSFVVISGGTGCNSICSAFGQSACYILPVSDDGGSSSEIIRVLGGPSIGVYASCLPRFNGVLNVWPELYRGHSLSPDPPDSPGGPGIAA